MFNSIETQPEIHELLKTRWSPRAYSSTPVEAEKIQSLFEAARWSPSGGNSQPWYFIVADQNKGEAHQKIVETLSGRNPDWAKNAPVLVLTVAKPNPAWPGANRYAYYDLGQSVAHLTVQAGVLGLYIHQMAGFDGAKARQLFEIPEGYEPLTVLAIGYLGNIEDLPEDLRVRESATRERKPLAEFVFNGKWGQSSEA
jgi:nitroreductase